MKLLTFMLFAWSALAAFAGEGRSVDRLDRAMQNREVPEFTVEQEPQGGIVARLIDTEGTIATIRDLSSPNFRTLTWSPTQGEGFEVVWTPSVGELALVLPSGERFVRTIDRTTGVVVADENATSAFASRFNEISVMAEVVVRAKNLVSSTDGTKGIRTIRSELVNDDKTTGTPLPVGTNPSGGALPPSAPPGGGSGPVIGCSYQYIRGNAYDEMSRALICERAKNDANMKCTNDLCWGCCKLLPCDAYCALGDYFCVVAGVYGQYCVRLH